MERISKMQKFKDFFTGPVMRILSALFAGNPSPAGREVTAKMDSREPEICVNNVLCFHSGCANHEPDSIGCNCRRIQIGRDGSCRTFIPTDWKQGESRHHSVNSSSSAATVHDGERHSE